MSSTNPIGTEISSAAPQRGAPHKTSSSVGPTGHGPFVEFDKSSIHPAAAAATLPSSHQDETTPLWAMQLLQTHQTIMAQQQQFFAQQLARQQQINEIMLKLLIAARFPSLPSSIVDTTSEVSSASAPPIIPPVATNNSTPTTVESRTQNSGFVQKLKSVSSSCSETGTPDGQVQAASSVVSAQPTAISATVAAIRAEHSVDTTHLAQLPTPAAVSSSAPQTAAHITGINDDCSFAIISLLAASQSSRHMADTSWPRPAPFIIKHRDRDKSLPRHTSGTSWSSTGRHILVDA